MKKLSILLFLFFSFHSLCQQTTLPRPEMNIDSFMKSRQIEAIGKPFPEFNTFLQEKAFKNQNLLGKVVFVNFWFESCAPCLAEFDALNDMYDKLKSKTDFEFISFTFEPQEKINEIVKKSNIQYKVVSLPENEIRRLNLNNGFPTSFILDRQGIIKFAKFTGSSDKKIATEIVLSDFYPKILTEL
jgi:cytochrome c biogenesis protein CcmG/thiol:disulfide interchange protein DsbE